MSARPITDSLRHISGGEFLDQVSEKMAELVKAVDESGKSGSITLKISVKKASRGGAMHITGKTTLQKPAEEPMEALLFATPEGNLIAEDPNQKKLDLKSVDSAPASVGQLKTA